MMSMKHGALLMLLVVANAWGQPSGYNYDESKVPKFDLPDPLVMSNGKRVSNAKMWVEQRRPELFKLVEEHVYGRSPKPSKFVEFKVDAVDSNALGGKATRKLVTIYFDSRNKQKYQAQLLMYVPNGKGPVPAFLGYNFNGNHTIHADKAIPVTKSWVRNNSKLGVKNNTATDANRGAAAGRWAVDMIIDQGYALATMYYGDVDPDYHDGFQDGIHPLGYKKGQTKPKPDEWGSVAAWAWGLSRALDYLETDDDVNAKQVAVMGHSRLGKTSLWAGATDQRFAIVISNNSGCGGAALSRRAFGETVKRINTSFPHWFCDNYVKYNDNENAAPVDQHSLIALIAPRPVYIASAQEDRWADPRGEFLSGFHASPVYKLLGTDGMAAKEMPGLSEPVMSTIGYHIRPGKHDVTDYDWQQYLNFADKHLGR